MRVVEKASVARPGTVRFETNRPLSGMGHEYFSSADDAFDPESPSHELARRLFERGGVDHVHVFGSVITVDLSKGRHSDGILPMIESLFTYYLDA